MKEIVNKNITLEVIKKNLHVYKGIGTFLPQIGCFFLKQECEVTLIGLNPHLFTLHDVGCSQEECRYRIEKAAIVLTKKYIGIKRFPKFMNAGGIITPVLITEKTLEGALDKGQYIIANVTDGRLYNKGSPVYNFHFICISGYDDHAFFVHDPLAIERGIEGYHPIKKEQLLYAIHAAAYGDVDNACCLFINKNNANKTL